jgi:hypothetical protein
MLVVKRYSFIKYSRGILTLANVEHLCYIARNKVGCTLNFWGEIIWQLGATTLNGM